jgi:hypothetical protein
MALRPNRHEREILERLVADYKKTTRGKRIMKLIGLDLGKNRTPFQNMTDEEEAQMKAELEAIHFFDRCYKSKTSLKPNRLGSIHQTTVTINACIHPSMFSI